MISSNTLKLTHWVVASANTVKYLSHQQQLLLSHTLLIYSLLPLSKQRQAKLAKGMIMKNWNELVEFQFNSFQLYSTTTLEYR